MKRERLIQEFEELARIDSISFQERQMADCLKGKLKELGFEVLEDQAGEQYGGNAGNIYGFLKGTRKGPGILLSAHMDTVQPGIGKTPVVHKDETITSQGDTVLGADDVAGLVEILEGIRSVQEEGVSYPDIEVLFPIAEELYIKGSNAFDFTRIQAKEAYVLDMSGKIGTAAIKAPSLISFQVTVTGKASHAGFAPEQGIHAIQIMSEAIGKIQQGHVDEESTVNIGTIAGGEASNIVPESCCCTGEIRSYSHKKALFYLKNIDEIFRKAVKKRQASYQLEREINLIAYEMDAKDLVVKRFEAACQKLGISSALTGTYGGSDNHNFVKNGIHGIVLSCGMQEVHSVREYIATEDLIKGAQLVAELIKAGS